MSVQVGQNSWEGCCSGTTFLPFRQVAKKLADFIALHIVERMPEYIGLMLENNAGYQVRRETGIARPSGLEIASQKSHMKHDNYDFLGDLNQFIREG